MECTGNLKANTHLKNNNNSEFANFVYLSTFISKCVNFLTQLNRIMNKLHKIFGQIFKTFSDLDFVF